VRVAIAVLLAGICKAACAHHGVAVAFIPDQTVEIDGVVRSVAWRNPHVSYTVDVTDDAGRTVTWSIESGGIAELRLRGLDRGFIEPGDRVRVSGLPSRRGGPEMFGTNLLLEDGSEVLFDVFSTPRLSEEVLTEEIDATAVARARQEADGLFRVWSTVLGDPDSFPWLARGAALPLTESAQRAADNWDASTDPRVVSCVKAMPLIMGAPTFMEFSRDGDDILLRIEEFDTRRTIHMTQSAPPADAPYSLLGYSVGRREGNRLVVETTKVEATIFGNGIPLSRQLHILESFEPSESGNRLDITTTITDPEALTTPLTLSRYLAWEPGVEIAQYNCEAYER